MYEESTADTRHPRGATDAAGQSVPGLLEQQTTRIVLLEESVAGLKDQINILKGEKKLTKFKPSAMDGSSDDQSSGTAKPGKLAGSTKR